MKCKIAIVSLQDDEKQSAFLGALLRSLEFFSLSTALEVTVIGKTKVPSGFKTTSMSPESVCSIRDFSASLPNWYKEQLAALFFSAYSSSEYTLVLPAGAFAIAPICDNSLLPRLKARTVWEPCSYHPDWWESARKATNRTAMSPYEGPTVFPGIMNRDLARWTLEIVSRESRREAIEALIHLSLSGTNWSAMSLYATASGSRFPLFHHDAFAAREYPLMSQQQLWSPQAQAAFHPAARSSADRGLFTYVHASALDNVEDVLDRLYACLKGRNYKLREESIVREERNISI